MAAVLFLIPSLSVVKEQSGRGQRNTTTRVELVELAELAELAVLAELTLLCLVEPDDLFDLGESESGGGGLLGNGVMTGGSGSTPLMRALSISLGIFMFWSLFFKL